MTEENENEMATAEEGRAVERQASKEERNCAMAYHLASLAGFIIPFGNILGPLIKKEKFPLVDDQGKEAVNFQITVFLAGLIGALLISLDFYSLKGVEVLIGFLVLLALAVYWLVFTVIAAMHASEGESFRYPYTLRLIK
jgi:uncharacterized Tic20 family protein